MKTMIRPAARVPARRAITALAAGTLGALATLGAAAVPAQAHTRAHDMIRHVSVKGCDDRVYERVPCGPWRLGMHSGKTATLPDALVWPLDAKGKTVKYMAAPIAVSGDGRSVAYFRKSDRRLVVRELGGAVHVMPKIKGLNMETAKLDLSQDGGHLLVDYYNGAYKRQPTRVYAVSNPGQGAALPAAAYNATFSGDGETLLTDFDADENTTALITYDTSGAELARVDPPQVIANNQPRALSSDGHTVAVYAGSSLKLYDMATDRLIRSLRVKLPGGTPPYMIDWTGEQQITLHVDRVKSMWIGEFDAETGASRVRDAYPLPKDAFVFAACGGG
ncbi:hypothetical protein [Microtetraspora sp. NBRC 16547]|uniref:hypothetical protein n=1 Tax=Microtetraspora sp. NBRC 16547 TaxID=3030993 RepID=UPI0024A3CFA9|nr:hypothetical protein [Microtetraspora sp. NBRC 16547]GLW98734.1 hypothetical protein Misp02_28210 [Microtetraspora sp. NBRC 16547]